VKYEPAAPVEVDINCNLLFFEKFWLGAGYRTGDALIGMVEYNVTPQLRAGYAYDFTLTDIADYSSGSHEIMIAYDFGKNVEVKTRSPRYF
jgi:type IX secretion system PorP/SprF family membrane protein